MSCGWHSASFIPVRFSWPGKERQAFHELPGVTETQQDVVGLLGTEAFLGPPFLDHRKWASFSLQGLPWIPKGRSKQLEKGGGAETRQEQSRNSVALERCPGFPSRDTHESMFELLCRYWKPIRWEKLTACCPQAQTPQEEPEGWRYRLPMSSPPTNQVHQLTTLSSLNHYYKNSSLPFWGWDIQFWGHYEVLPWPGRGSFWGRS